MISIESKILKQSPVIEHVYSQNEQLRELLLKTHSREAQTVVFVDVKSLLRRDFVMVVVVVVFYEEKIYYYFLSL